MAKRVYELARTLEVKSADLLTDLQAMGYDVSTAASSVTDEEAEAIVRAFAEAAQAEGSGGGEDDDFEAAGTEADDEGPPDEEAGVGVTMIEPDGGGEAEPEPTPAAEPDPKAILADAAKSKREALAARMQALLDDPGVDLEACLATLLEGEENPLGRRWRLIGKGSVTHGQLKVIKNETISDDQYQVLPRRVQAFFVVVEAQ